VSGPKSINTRKRVFVHPSLAAESLQKKRFPYDELASGETVYAYVGGDPVNFADPLGLCKVVFDFSEVALHGYHISVNTSDSHGTMWFAGGPTRNPFGRDANPQPGDWPYAWGFLRGSYGKLDSLPSGPNTQVVVDDGKSCSCYNKSFENTIDQINASNIPYSPVFQNSNSLAATILRNAGANVPNTWPYWTPAYSNDLNKYLNH
jgi:hypothetical protein